MYCKRSATIATMVMHAVGVTAVMCGAWCMAADVRASRDGASGGAALLEARSEWADEAVEEMPPASGDVLPWSSAQEGRTTGPDLIVADLSGVRRWGSSGGVTAYSVGTTVCNRGSTAASWVLNTAAHPIVPQHMYRLKDGRFEQIGLSWCTHTFYPLNGTFCSGDCQPGGKSALGPECSDVHSTSVNGLQPNMAPRYQVNAATGVFPYPWSSPPGAIPPIIGRRLQVNNTDLEPTTNVGAIYFVEGQYVTADETAAGNGKNNVSHRRVYIWRDIGTPPVYEVGLLPGYATERRRPALLAWQDVDPMVAIVTLDIPSDGRMLLASRATALGGGWYHYEYALYNMNSDRAAAGFAVPLPGGVSVTNVGFHDVHDHSNSPVSTAEWPGGVLGSAVAWSTSLYTVDPYANAVRWGTTYNFRFDADAPPGTVSATIGLFKPGTPSSVTMAARGPRLLTGADCDGNGIDDAVDIFEGTSADCNVNGTPDACDMAAGTSADCSGNGTPDECEPDCNANGVADSCDILLGTSGDCDGNGEPDECTLADNPAYDCNTNGVLDGCDVAAGTSADCNTNQVPDECEADCNHNHTPDACDLALGTSVDCNANGTPDECETTGDCNHNSVPDLCEIGAGTSQDCNHNNTPDECESPADCNTNGVRDFCDLTVGTSSDCNHNGTPDECDIRAGTSLDCNGSHMPDECESQADCDANGTPDLCDVARGTSTDCNLNWIPDACDIAAGTSADEQRNGVPDECEQAVPAVAPAGVVLLGAGLAGLGAWVFRRRPATLRVRGR